MGTGIGLMLLIKVLASVAFAFYAYRVVRPLISGSSDEEDAMDRKTELLRNEYKAQQMAKEAAGDKNDLVENPAT